MLCKRCGSSEVKQNDNWCETCHEIIIDKTDSLILDLRESFDAGALDNFEVHRLLEQFVADMYKVLVKSDNVHAKDQEGKQC